MHKQCMNCQGYNRSYYRWCQRCSYTFPVTPTSPINPSGGSVEYCSRPLEEGLIQNRYQTLSPDHKFDVRIEHAKKFVVSIDKRIEQCNEGLKCMLKQKQIMIEDKMLAQKDMATFANGGTFPTLIQQAKKSYNFLTAIIESAILPHSPQEHLKSAHDLLTEIFDYEFLKSHPSVIH